ncbi:MAG: hypothetical protein RL456_355 [Pseudomonadota bacterium]|jgi:hypothetical protein
MYFATGSFFATKFTQLVAHTTNEFAKPDA